MRANRNRLRPVVVVAHVVQPVARSILQPAVYCFQNIIYATSVIRLVGTLLCATCCYHKTVKQVE